jgi:hypothetical protein
MLRKSIPLLLLALLFAAPARSETVDEILAMSYKAQGGLENLQKLKTIRMVGKMTMGPGMEAPFKMEKKRPGMMRMEFTFSGMTGMTGWDGKHGWQFMPFMGQKKAEPISEEDAKDSADRADFDGALVDWKAKGHVAELLGKESVDGADAWKIKLTKRNGQVDTYFIDAETYLVVKVQGKRMVRGTEITGESTLGGYKEVHGLMFPFSMTNGVAGSEQKQALTFDSIEVDVPMDDATFQMPAAPDSTGAATAPDAPKPAATPKKK